MTAEPTLFERIAAAKKVHLHTICEHVNNILLAEAVEDLTTDKFAIPIKNFPISWKSKYEMYIIGYCQSQGVKFHLSDDILHFELPSFAMVDILNKSKNVQPKDFELHPNFSPLAATGASQGYTIITKIVEKRDADLLDCIKNFEDDLIRKIEKCLSFRNESDRTFDIKLKRIFDCKDKSERLFMGNFLVDHFTQKGLNIRLHSKYLGITIPE